MTAIPERLVAKTKEILRGEMCGYATCARPSWNACMCFRTIATALHEIEQAALAEGERAGLERAAKWHEAQAIASDSRITDARHRDYAKALRALPTPDAPAKEA